MSYSLDLRQRVVSFVSEGGSVCEASECFKVSRATIYRWKARPSLEVTRVKRRRRKLDDQALLEHVRRYPSMTLKERARHFQVYPHAIRCAFERLKVTRKKNSFDGVNGVASYVWHICKTYEPG